MFLDLKSCLCTIVLLATGSSFGAAALFSSHQYPPPQTTSLYRLIGRQYLPLLWSTQSSEGYQQSGTATSDYEPTNLASSYQPASYPVTSSGHDNSAYKSNGQSQDFMSILELANRQRYNQESLAHPSFPNYQQEQQQQYQEDSVDYIPHTQTKQHYHDYRGPQSAPVKQDEASTGEYPHQLEPMIYESDGPVHYGAQEKYPGEAQQMSELSIYNNLYNAQQQPAAHHIIK